MAKVLFSFDEIPVLALVMAIGIVAISIQSPDENAPEVFISYNWGKQSEADVLYHKLKENGFNCWMDIYRMGGGDSFYHRIDKGVRGCKVVISFVTDEYTGSDNCQKEISLADALKRPIIPLLLEKMDWPPPGPMAMIFSQLLYINCYRDENLQLTWTGPRFNELLTKLRAIVPQKSTPAKVKDSGSDKTDGTQKSVPDTKTKKKEENEARRKFATVVTQAKGLKKRDVTQNQELTGAKLAAFKKSKLITAAIDFGTAFCGYAYGFKGDLENDPPTIITNQWAGGRTISHKAPTSVLFNSDGSMNSFGYKAEEKYAELCANGQHDSYYFFQRFKMMLNSKKPFSKTTMLTEEGGKRMPALDVFAAAISFVKQHLLDTVHLKVSSITEDDVNWILTVPAIWTENAKQFMREAAELAGIAHAQLSIALEPECASVYCQRIQTEKMKDADGVKLQIAEPHSKFVILDLGGGTADITVHERQPDGTLKELDKASGGPWGGTKVDLEFINLLCTIFGGENIGHDIFNTFKTSSMEDYIDLLREFEVKKRDTKIEGDGRATIKVPVSLTEILEEQTGIKLKQVIGTTDFGDQISLTSNSDRMKLQAPVMRSLFAPAVNSIVEHLKDLFKRPEVSNVDTILMVGGFSGSAFVQDTIRKEFPSKKIYIPAEPDMAVLMGAVLFGSNPDAISFRKSRFTYGIASSQKFKVGDHDEAKKRVFDGEDYCVDCFSTLVEVNQVLKVGGTPITKNYNPVEADDTSMSITIYASAEKSPKYVTDKSCQRLGAFVVSMPDKEGGKKRKVEVKVNFSGTELEVEALEKKTMKTYKTKVNFLE